jgi:hypothetical protein
MATSMLSLPQSFSFPPPHPKRPSRGSRALLLALGIAGVVLVARPGLAQSEAFLLKPGSKVGPASNVKATNCKTNPADGSITCDTKIVNPPGDTQAKPQYSPFKP